MILFGTLAGLVILSAVTKVIIHINKLRDQAHLIRMKRQTEENHNRWTR